MFDNNIYNQSIRKCIVAFGTLLNNIELNRYDEEGNIIKKFKVPLKYASKDKLIQRAKSRPDLVEDGDLQYSLPRMSFVMTNISYDSSRKLNVIQKIAANKLTTAGNDVYFAPMPCIVNFELNVLTKTNDEALEIIEKIVPIFQPSFFVTVNIAEDNEELRDLAFTLNSVNFNDSFESGFENTRFVLYTLSFKAKTYIMSTPSNESSIIKKAIANIYTNLTINSSSGGRRFIATPKALQDYNEDGVIDELDDPLIIPGDDFGTVTIWSDFDGQP